MYPKDYDPAAFVSNPGDRWKPEYIGEEDEDGIIQLVEVGKTDLVELHQRDAFCNDVNVLYQRFCNGDVTAFQQTQGNYMDVLGMPRDLRGMLDLVDGFRQSYDNLPQELKDKYTFDQFIDKAGSEQWIKDFSPPAAAAGSDASPSPADSSVPAAAAAAD